jgi:hypothetical protein
MDEKRRGYEMQFLAREKPNFSQLRELWSENPEDFQYDNICSGPEYGLPSFAEMKKIFDDAVVEIQELFVITDRSEEDDETDDLEGDDPEQFVSSEKLLPKSLNFHRDTLKSALYLVQKSFSRLSGVVEFLDQIIDNNTDDSQKIYPLEQTRNHIRSYTIRLLEYKRQMVMYNETALPIKKTIEMGIAQGNSKQAIRRVLKSVLESAGIWEDVTNIHRAAIESIFFQDSDQKSLFENLQNRTGFPHEILRQDDFLEEAETFLGTVTKSKMYDFAVAVYRYLRSLEDKRSGVALLLNHIVVKKTEIDLRTKKKSSEPKEDKRVSVSEDQIAEVKLALELIKSEINKLAPCVALLAQKNFLRPEISRDMNPEKTKWANFTNEFKEFKDSCFPVFEYLNMMPAVGERISYGVLRNIKTGSEYSVARFGGSIPEALKKLGGRLSVPRRIQTKK